MYLSFAFQTKYFIKTHNYWKKIKQNKSDLENNI